MGGLAVISLPPTARDILLVDARSDAAAQVAAAEAQASAVLGGARRDAEALLAQARAEGEQLGRAEDARSEDRARVASRAVVLAARRETYELLRRRTREAALALRDEPQYPKLLRQLEAAARADLGADTTLEVDPPDAGGVRARAGSRHVDYTLVGLADRCLDARASKIGALWE